MLKTSLKALLIASALAAPMAASGQVVMTIPSDPETRKISVVTDKGLRSTKSLRSAELREARRAMNDKQVISEDLLKRLADKGDGLAAKKYADILLSRGGDDTASDIATYMATAAAQGRVYALRPMIEAMHRLDPETEPAARKKKYISVLYPHAWAGNSLALDAVIDFNGEGKLFGAMSSKTRAKILEHSKGGNGRVEMRLAMIALLKKDRTAADVALARSYLQTALTSKSLAVQTTAKNLLPLLEDAEKSTSAALVQN